MKTSMTQRIFSLFLCLVLLAGMLPVALVTAYDDYEQEEAVEMPIPVSTEGKTYRLFTQDNLEQQYGISFLYVMERDGRYYTPAHPGVKETTALDSVAAVDITAYWNEESHSFFGIPDSLKVGVMQYQTYPFPGEWGGSALFMDGEMMFALSVPFESQGETWFENGLCYYEREDTYSYSRALWEANGDGSGYLYDLYIDWYGDSDEWVVGAVDLYESETGELRFGLRNVSDAYNNEEHVGVNGYLYAASCGHASTEHAFYDAPTCMDKGCGEYWYCYYCNTYYKDEACTESYSARPVLPALGHDYGENACLNCGRLVPQYTKITSYDQFRTLSPDASFIVVTEVDDGAGGKEYYVLKESTDYINSDVDEDGVADVLAVDLDGNGFADILEVDADGDGVADAMLYDGFFSEEYLNGILEEDEIFQYLFELEMQYTDGYMVGMRYLEAIPVTVQEDGTITVKDLDALEFVMERVIPDEELINQYYGDGATRLDYENDFRFRIPNFWIRPMVTVDNNYYQQPYEFGDAKWWGVLFGADVKEAGIYNTDLFDSYPDDAAILYTESFGNVNAYGEVNHGLRFLVNGDEKGFIITSESFWEELEGEELPVYLYASEQGSLDHEHVYGAWESYSEEIHRRTCTVGDCDHYELAGHSASEGCEPDWENPQLGHWVTCTVCDGSFHEYHTREKYNYRYPNMWKDAGDGVNHVVYCTVCKGPAAYEEHIWSQWSRSGYYDSATQTTVWGHRRTCTEFPCPGEEFVLECVYDEGVITKEPTCEESGVMTYTCLASGCQFETKTYTKEIPALEHDWGEWTATEDPAKEVRVCLRDPSHVEEREVIVHEHQWSEWEKTGDHTYARVCSECKAEEAMTLEEDKPVNVTPSDNAANTNLNETDIELIAKLLTQEEQSLVAEGAEVKVYLKVEDVSDTVSTEHKQEAEAAAGEDEIGMYLDIDLFKQVGSAQETRISQLSEKVSISITIPESLINTDAGVSRTYKIIRVHEDQEGNRITEVIEGVFNPEDNSFTFETDRFSTYALAYSDEQSFLPGDANGDLSVNFADIQRIYQHMSTANKLEGTKLLAADANGDANVSFADIQRIYQHLSTDNKLF